MNEGQKELREALEGDPKAMASSFRLTAELLRELRAELTPSAITARIDAWIDRVSE